MIQKQCFAIADTRVPVTATPLSFFYYIDVHPDRNRIFLVGHHQGACRLMLPGLHRIDSVSSCYKMLPTYIDSARLVSSESGGDYLPPTSLYNVNILGSMTQGEWEVMEGERWCWRMVGKVDDSDGHASESGAIWEFVSYLINAKVEFRLTYC